MNNNGIPITIFTGFLGSGKSTIINNLVKNNTMTKFAVVINEFGKTGIDSRIVESVEEATVEISNGCACCVVRTDLEKGIEKLIQQYQPEYILIEASGLAEPGPIAQTFVHNLSLGKQTYMDGIVCVIDCAHFQEMWEKYDILKQQLMVCDIIVLNKIELIPEHTVKVRKFIMSIKPDAYILENPLDESVDLSVLIETSLHIQDNDDNHHHHHDHEHFDEISFETAHRLDAEKLDAVFLQDTFQQIVRAKGILNFDHSRETSFLFQLVGHGRQLSPLPHSESKSRLVMIGEHLDKEFIIASLVSCEIQ